MKSRSVIVAILMAFLSTSAGAGDLPKPVRIASGVSGHIHPAVCLSKKGTIVVIYGQSDYKDLRVTRSSDGGAKWTTPEPFAPSAKQSIYPGSLTALKDGRIVHAWNVWYSDEPKKKSRYVQYSISSDEGKTWTEPKSLPKNPKAESIIRHPFIELSPRAWLMPLADQTIEYNPETGKIVPFGDGHKHGLVPMVLTPKGTFVSGVGQRSTDAGKSWKTIEPFPDLAKQGWRHEMMGLYNGWLIASKIDGAGVGGDLIRFVVSKDDGQTWDLKGALEYYNPGRPIGGRACPRTIELDAKTIGTVFYDVDARQAGGPGVFFLRMPIARFK